MRILLVSPCFPPYPSSASLRTHAFARTWAEDGHDVTVLTTEKADDHHGMPLPHEGYTLVEVPVPVPAVLRWVRRRSRPAAGEATANGAATNGGASATHVASNGSSTNGSPANGSPTNGSPTNGSPRNGVVHAGEAHAARRPGPLARWRTRTGIFAGVRMPDLTDHWVGPAIERAVATARNGAPWDLVVSSAGPYTAHRVARALRQRDVAAHWVADYRDLWTDNELFSGLPLIAAWERRLETACLREADLVTTVSDGLASALQTRTTTPVSVVYNGFDPAELAALDPSPVFPADGRFRLVFTGALYEQRQDPDALIAALATIAGPQGTHPDRVRLAVASHDAGGWLRAAARHGVAHLIEACGWVARGTSLRMQRDADAIVHVEWNDATAGVLTGKLFEYLVAGPPIVVVGGDPRAPEGRGPIAALVERTERGTVVGRDAEAATAWLRGLVAESPRDPGRTGAGITSEAGTERRARLRRKLAEYGRPAQSRRVLEDLTSRVHELPVVTEAARETPHAAASESPLGAEAGASNGAVANQIVEVTPNGTPASPADPLTHAARDRHPRPTPMP